MNLDEQEVRALVREAIERHLRGPYVGVRETGRGANLTGTGGVSPSSLTSFPFAASHMLLPVNAGSELGDGMCVIEPAVRCTHCGFCRSFGH
jgi:hypothetical protein